MTLKRWHLNKGAERKFRRGHPWVFSNELSHSPLDVMPGEIVELRDFQDSFLARGYAHPNSLICFRVVSRNEDELDILSAEFLVARFKRAYQLRQTSGWNRASYRLCFAEADQLPGLIVDRFRLPDQRQCFVVQSSTAGIDRVLPQVMSALEMYVRELGEPSWENTALILSNNSKAREMEGLAVEPRSIVKDIAGIDWERVPIEIATAGIDHLTLTTDLIKGQKTGFFLDQAVNVQMVTRQLESRLKLGSSLKILDLCCYVGQWATQLAHVARNHQITAECHLVDASARALELAARNVQSQGATVTTRKMDVLADLKQLPEREYDVVICDPPAFIKRKKDLATGEMAYQKLNRDAMRLVRPGGLFVSCSCSGLFIEDEFKKTLAVAASKSGRSIQWILRGSQSPDHPIRMEYPEGHYLKCHIGVLEK